MELYSIGKLSKETGLSPDTLRHYDAIGLLKPAYISQDTGYRYYSDEQAGDLAAILELKAYDFSLKEIKGIMANAGGGTVLQQAFRQRYTQLLQEKERIETALDKLAHKIQNLEVQEAANYV